MIKKNIAKALDYINKSGNYLEGKPENLIKGLKYLQERISYKTSMTNT